MDAPHPPSAGHYGVLGVRPGASPREIEVAFQAWAARRASGGADLEAYRRAEAAYHLLADPAARARHDRQLGLCRHPAWSAGTERTAGAARLRAVQLLARDRNVQARQLLERIAPLAPGDPPTRSYLGVALARTGGDLHEAVRHARFAVELRPREPAFLFNLAEVYAAAGLCTRSLGARARAWRAVAAALLRRHSRHCDAGHSVEPADRIRSSRRGARHGTGGRQAAAGSQAGRGAEGHG